MAIRVLLAEDHAVVRDGLKMLLEAHGDIRAVGSAADARTALRSIPDLNPEIIIMDITMPGMDGIEAAERVQKEYPAIGVIILTVHSSSEYIFRALRAGVRGYLVKESAGDEVVDAVHAVHSGRQYFSGVVAERLEKSPDRWKKLGGKSPLECLSAREREILYLLAEGRTNQEIADFLLISIKTVETYRSRMMQKLEIHDLASLVKFAIRNGMSSL